MKLVDENNMAGGKTTARNGGGEPIFKPIFGDAWNDLPVVIKKHYANRPFTTDRVTVEGHLDISCAWQMRLLSPLLWLMGSVPPVNEKAVPVTVHFDSSPENRRFSFNRVFHFRLRRSYSFRSSMIQIFDNEVVEVMRYGVCWRMNYLWREGKVILQHKGYALMVFGGLVPLPLTFLLGRGDAEEVAVDENSFEMRATVTHFWFGKVYEYKGRFRVI